MHLVVYELTRLFSHLVLSTGRGQQPEQKNIQKLLTKTHSLASKWKSEESKTDQ